MFYIPALAGGVVSFAYSYTGDPRDDPFGYILDNGDGTIDEDDFNFLVGSSLAPGSYTPADIVDESGTASFTVEADQLFGFFIRTRTNNFGPGSAVISNFGAPGTTVPLPGTVALMGLALIIPAMRRRH
jgi:hypothetical protein